MLAGFERAEKALLSFHQSIDVETRQLESRTRHASLGRSKLASFQKNLEHQISIIKRLLEAAAGMKSDHENVLKNISQTIVQLPKDKSEIASSDVSIRDLKCKEIANFKSINLSALYWGFHSSALKRLLSTKDQVFEKLSFSSRRNLLSNQLLYLDPVAILDMLQNQMIILNCRMTLRDRLNKVLGDAKSSKYDEKRVKAIIDKHNKEATASWEQWSVELTEACRDCQQAVDDGIGEFRKLAHEWRVLPGQFAADFVQLDGMPYREYYKNVLFLTDSLRQREENTFDESKDF